MTRLACSWCAILILLVATQAVADSETPADGARWGRESLESRTDLPWYNPSTDQLRRIDVAPNPDDEHRHSRWARNVKSRNRPAAAHTTNSMAILEIFAWILLGGLLGVLLWLLVRAAMRGDSSHGRSVKAEPVTVSSGRIEDLPMAVAPQHQDLLAAAREYYAAGNLAAAIIYAFAHQLVELDKHHLIQLSKGKTNRQYLNELKMHPDLTGLVRPTMLAFEDVFFGHHDLAPDRFRTCWENLDQFHQQLQQVAS